MGCRTPPKTGMMSVRATPSWTYWGGGGGGGGRGGLRLNAMARVSGHCCGARKTSPVAVSCCLVLLCRADPSCSLPDQESDQIRGQLHLACTNLAAAAKTQEACGVLRRRVAAADSLPSYSVLSQADIEKLRAELNQAVAAAKSKEACDVLRLRLTVFRPLL